MFETTDIPIRFQKRLQGRIQRARFIEETRPHFVAMTSLDLVGVKNAEGAYVDGHFLASFLASIAGIEQTLREQLPDADDRLYLRDIIDGIEEEPDFSAEAVERLRVVKTKRNAHIHYRGSKGPDDQTEALVERVTQEDAHPNEIMSEDAELALQSLYDVLELAKHEIPDGALPTDDTDGP